MPLSASAFVPGSPPAEYAAAVAQLSELLLASGFYVRPAASACPSPSLGSIWVLPEAERRVPESVSMARHIELASALPFPAPELVGFADRADLVAAVRQCVASGAGLSAWRASRVRRVTVIAASLAAYNRRFLELAQPSALSLVSDMNLAFLAAWVDAARWPDVRIVERFVFGFPIVGEVPDSGLFRPVERPATEPPFSAQANARWTNRLASSIARIGMSVAAASRRIGAAVEAATAREVSAGLIRGPFSRRHLDRVFGRGAWRPMRRFGVEQGTPPDAKVRAIDNARASGHTAVTSTHETIRCISVVFVAQVAHLFRVTSAAAGLPMVALRLGLDDMRAAYRRIPVDAPWHTVFAIWSYRAKAVQYFYLPGHNFGMASAVLNFNRFPELMVALARSLFAVPADHYFDDYILVDPAAAKSSGQICLAVSHELVGQSLEPSKRKPMAYVNVALGVLANLVSVVTEGVVTFMPTLRRRRAVLAMLRAARSSNCLTPELASTVRGKLGFVFSAAYGRVGRAAAQVLVRREFYDTCYEWDAALEAALDFYTALFAHFPPLRVPIMPDPRGPLLVYTDAMFAPGPVALARVAFVIIDPSGSQPTRVGYADVPADVMAMFAPDRKTYILQAELIAAVAVPWSLPGAVRGRCANFFIDNTGALAHLVHGYAGAAAGDCALLVNSFHLAAAALRFRPWFDWVPSAANVADLPTRLALATLAEVLAEVLGTYVEVPFVFPPFASLQAPLGELASLAFAL